MMENSLAKKYRDESVANQESEARENECSVPSAKKPRTSEDFYLFCKFILEYENYGLTKEEEVLEKQVNPHDSSDLPNGGNRILSPHSDQDTSSKEQNNIELKGNPNLAVPTPHDILSVTVKSPSTEDEFEVEESSDEDSYDLVTCFCKKPFAGRPMIECSKCLTWIHLSCAKVRKSHIPDVYICPSCKEDSSL